MRRIGCHTALSSAAVLFRRPPIPNTMANKSPQRSTRTNSKPINAKPRPTNRRVSPKAWVKNEGKAPRPSHVVNLINDTLWLLALAAAIFVALSLASFTMTDPAWSRSVAASDEAVRNLGGLFGAYLADVGYYLSAYRCGGG